MFLKNLRDLKPEHLIVASFGGVILVGMVLFMLPFATTKGSMNIVDAMFMATSAVCVTGLSVLDVSRDLTFWGQLILIVLVQIGGLGIMTFSILFFMMLGKQPSFRSKTSAGTFSLKMDSKSIKHILGFVLITTLIIEGIGALFLFVYLKEIHPMSLAIFSSIFHSIAAFCNAGFSIYPDSLMQFHQKLFVPIVIMILIVAGGLGFTVIDELLARLMRDRKEPKTHLSFHSKMVLLGTFFLILFGACLFWFLECLTALLEKPIHAQFINSMFLSITPRTAGFNMVDLNAMSDAGLFFTILLMFVGGSPGSTAGGVKVTTFIILMALITSKIKGHHMVPLFKRKVPWLVVDKALAIFAAFFLTIIGAILLLLVTETYFGHWHPAQHDFFLKLVFEVVSAICTVGLSTGITPHLSYIGKLIIVALMFVGRVGPVTLMISIQTRRKKNVDFNYAEEDVMVG